MDMNTVLKFLTGNLAVWKRDGCKCICIGHWINYEMRKCVARAKVRIYFPPLITNLCHKKEVIIYLIEQSHQPVRSIIGDSMLHQFQALH
ncbi:hypothetical protein J1N35_010660 [Gossypium stocksii]|uniref:Uncharacterized protein n=1 Tax=Gossypium stocksii TaxID=47602 RepID=A0A9D3W1S3_9ROSI|nr:hypothetical protein J1N35_010660 [Gossypium stocksii]